MVNRILKYLIQRLVGKRHNCIILHPDCIIVTELLEYEYNTKLNVTKDTFGNFIPKQTKKMLIKGDPEETLFIF